MRYGSDSLGVLYVLVAKVGILMIVVKAWMIVVQNKCSIFR